MADNIENEAIVTPPEAPKKKRAPRKPKAEAAPAEVEKPKRAPRVAKLPNAIKLDGRVIVVTGTDVYVRDMDAAARTKHGIKQVEGTLGKPCAEMLTLTFKSPKAAAVFFNESFTAENEDDEMIVAGSKTDWEGDTIDSIFD